jgi:hypothetical protein
MASYELLGKLLIFIPNGISSMVFVCLCRQMISLSNNHDKSWLFFRFQGEKNQYSLRWPYSPQVPYPSQCSSRCHLRMLETVVGAKCSLVLIPEVTLTSLDSCPPTLTLCVWPTRNSLTQMTTLIFTPEAASFVSRLWGTKLKALEKLFMISSVPTALF